MQQAISLAEHAASQGEVPVGAVLVRDNTLLGEGWNQPISAHDPSAHAEMLALRAAATQQQNYRLPGTTLYVTLEPCLMCMGVLLHARVARLVFGAHDPKVSTAQRMRELAGEVSLNHQLDIQGGLLEDQCSRLLTCFFKARR